MNKEDKDLLFKDLCARLPYGVKLQKFNEPDSAFELYSFNNESGEIMFYKYRGKALEIADVGRLYRHNVLLYKPFLRPMSSMTEEERKEFSKLLVKRYCEEDWEGHISTSYCIEIDNVYTDDEDGIKYPSAFSMDAIDWLNAHHFDYRGLIEKGLALEALEGMYE